MVCFSLLEAVVKLTVDLVIEEEVEQVPPSVQVKDTLTVRVMDLWENTVVEVHHVLMEVYMVAGLAPQCMVEGSPP